MDRESFNINDIVLAAVNQLKTEASRLGISWNLIPATVATISGSSGGEWPASNVYVIQDNDTNVSRSMSLIGRVRPGTRVMLMHVPPQGNYIIGSLGDSLRRITDSTRISSRNTAISSNDISLSTATQSVPNTLITVPCVTGTLYYDAWGVFDFDETVIGTTVCQGRLAVDNVIQPGDANFEVTNINDRATVTQIWSGAVSGVGNHEFELRTMRTINAGEQQVRALHTRLRVITYE